VLLIPGILLALITVHLFLVVYHKHTQYRGPGRTEKNVVGFPLFPVYVAKAGGFFFVVFGVTALMGALLQINPIWLYGPYNPAEVTAGSQPDWYMGWLDGAVRLMPGAESHFWGVTVSWNIFLPALLVPPLFIGFVALYPFLEAWITGDRRERVRSALSRFYFADAVQKPTAAELEAAHADDADHADHADHAAETDGTRELESATKRERSRI